MINNKPVVCECGKRFASAHTLEQHRRDSPKHSGGPSTLTASSTNLSPHCQRKAATTATNNPTQQAQTGTTAAAKRPPPAAAVTPAPPHPADSSSVKGKQPAAAANTTTTTTHKNAPAQAAEAVAAQTPAGALPDVKSTSTTLQCCGRTFRASKDLAQHQKTASRHASGLQNMGGRHHSSTKRAVAVAAAPRRQRAPAAPARTYYQEYVDLAYHGESQDWGLCDKDCGWCGRCMGGAGI